MTTHSSVKETNENFTRNLEVLAKEILLKFSVRENHKNAILDYILRSFNLNVSYY